MTVQGEATHVPADAARNANIHGLRGVLAFAVFIFHVGNSGLPTFHGPIADAVNYVGDSLEHAVEIFFGISGIVIWHAFLKSPGPRHFLLNRITRIWPVLWVTVLVIALLARFDARHVRDISPAILAANLAALPPLLPLPLINPAAWSISLEFAFYAMFVAYALARRVFPLKVAAVLVAGVALVLLNHSPRAVGFVLGLAVVFWPRSRLPAWLLRCSGLFLLSGMVAWHWVTDIIRAHRPDSYVDVMMSHGDVAAGFAAGCLLVWIGLKGAYLGHGLFARFLERPVCQWLGTISFSLYLWSPIVMAPVKKLMMVAHLPTLLGPWCQLAFLALSVLPLLWVAVQSQRWLEGAFTRWLRRTFQRLPRRPEPLEGVAGTTD